MLSIYCCWVRGGAGGQLPRYWYWSIFLTTRPHCPKAKGSHVVNRSWMCVIDLRSLHKKTAWLMCSMSFGCYLIQHQILHVCMETENEVWWSARKRVNLCLCINRHWQETWVEEALALNSPRRSAAILSSVVLKCLVLPAGFGVLFSNWSLWLCHFGRSLEKISNL